MASTQMRLSPAEPGACAASPTVGSAPALESAVLGCRLMPSLRARAPPRAAPSSYHAMAADTPCSRPQADPAAAWGVGGPAAGLLRRDLSGATTRHREAEGSSCRRRFHMGLLREDGAPKPGLEASAD